MPPDKAQSRWVQRVKAKPTRVLLCKSLNYLGKQRPKVTRIPIHLGNPGFNLGGNQSNAVTVSPLAKDRLLGCRWPTSASIGTIRLAKMKGGELSVDEA